GETKDLAVLDTLLEWTKKGKPRACRSAAVRALTRLAQTADPSEEQQKRILAAVTASLEGDGGMLRFSAISALGDLAQFSPAAQAKLEDLTQNEPDERIREMAKRTGERARARTPAATGDAAKLRQELERLKKEQELLRERLNKLEKGERKGEKPAAGPFGCSRNPAGEREARAPLPGYGYPRDRGSNGNTDQLDLARGG